MLQMASRLGVDDTLLGAVQQQLVLYAAYHARTVLKYLSTHARPIAQAAVDAAIAYGQWESESKSGAPWADVVADAELTREEAQHLVHDLNESAVSTSQVLAARSAMLAAQSVRGGQINEANITYTAYDAIYAASSADAVQAAEPPQYLVDVGAFPPFLPPPQPEDWTNKEVVAIIKRVIPWPRSWKVGDVVAHGDGWVLWHAFDEALKHSDPPLFSAQVTPRGKFSGWLPNVPLYDAIDFVGHQGPDAMRSALEQMGGVAA